MARRPSRRRLAPEVEARFPKLADPIGQIRLGRVIVDGAVMTNPASQVRRGAHIVLRMPAPLHGEAKLAAAVDLFLVHICSRVALDLGAAAGGFTQVLLDRGARRVYAVDAGHGQLRGWLRQDQRVVNLERTNLAVLDETLVRDAIDVVTVDLSYLSVASALGQLSGIRLAAGADLIALVKPMFELAAGRLPTGEQELASAVGRARAGAEAAGWSFRGSARSPVDGRLGAVEYLLHGTRPAEAP
jgi:23S rRNA (cytidine1920-2'-O)/16S rRNA (cytidine1409-2'-O)-methyltransferase